MVGYGRHSETERVLVNSEGLTIQSLLKIQSTLLGNLEDIHGDEFTHGSRCRIGRRIEKLGSSAISNNQSCEQQANHWYLSRFHAWIKSFHKGKHQIHATRGDEYTDDVSTRERICVIRQGRYHYKF